MNCLVIWGFNLNFLEWLIIFSFVMFWTVFLLTKSYENDEEFDGNNGKVDKEIENNKEIN